MKHIRICSVSTFFFAVVFYSIPSQAQTAAELRQQLIGQWRNLTLHLEVIDAANPKDIHVLNYNRANWEDSLGIRPIRTFFNGDGTFYSEYYTLKDSLFYRPSGKWALEKNIITFYYEKPKADTMQFALTIKENIASFRGKVDWSGDGKKDDDYTGTQQKQ